MKRKWAIRGLFALLLIVAMASSVKIEKLDVVRARASKGLFDAEAYALEFWENGLIPNLDQAVEIKHLMNLLENKPEEAFENYSKKIGIGDIRFFMVRGQGEILNMGKDDLSLLLETDSTSHVVQIETEYIFGNAVRNASGRIKPGEFEETMDFNNVSAEINQLIRQRVLPYLKKNAREGKQLHFVGAVEMNRLRGNFRNIEIIPVSVKFLEEKKVLEDAGS